MATRAFARPKLLDSIDSNQMNAQMTAALGFDAKTAADHTFIYVSADQLVDATFDKVINDQINAYVFDPFYVIPPPPPNQQEASLQSLHDGVRNTLRNWDTLNGDQRVDALKTALTQLTEITGILSDDGA